MHSSVQASDTLKTAQLCPEIYDTTSGGKKANLLRTWADFAAFAETAARTSRISATS